MSEERSASGARRHIILAMLALVVSTGHNPAATQAERGDGLTAQERRGKDIYFGAATTVKARIGNPPIEAPAMLLACANCHGSDARGKPEGGIVPSDITWDALTKPYGVRHPSGRTHPPYTDRLLVRAIALGIDPAGNSLHAAMPRFEMSHADIAALTEYLKRLSTEVPAGISDSAIRLGTVLPSAGPLATAGGAVTAVLTAYFAAVNAQGGIYGRRLELSVAEIGGMEADTTVRVEAFLRETAPFAMVGGLLAGTGNDAIALTEARGVPFVGPLTIFPELEGAGRTTFYLLSGVEQQARALMDFGRTIAGNAASPASARSMAIVHSADTVPANVVGRIKSHGTETGWHVTAVNLDREGVTMRAMADELARSAATCTLFLIGADKVGEIATEIASIGAHPFLLVPGSLATNHLLRLPQPLVERTFIGLPSLPSDQTPAALAEYRTLADAYHLPSTHMAWQLEALGSAKVLVQALKGAGQGLTRATLVAALEGLSDFDSGLMPRIRFGRGRHIGAAGAYIVALDPARQEFRPVTNWLRVN